ncbi:hypothetical protein BH23GEM7_BH23GEM7_41140 [soil metagenome]
MAAQEPIPVPARVQIATGTAPDTVTVGDPFQALIRVSAPAGSRIEFPPLPAGVEALELRDSLRVVTGAESSEGEMAIYALVAWRTGGLVVPPLPVSVTLPDGSRVVYRVTLRLPWVRSVLPPEPAEVEPRGAKDVLDTERAAAWWPILLALALLLAALAAYLLWRRRRAAETVPLSPPLSPRAQALATLDRARTLRPAEGGAWKPFFSLLSGALRGYLAALSPRWSEDLTTRELLRALDRDVVDAAQLRPLRDVLELADRVKFARYRPDPAEAEEAWVAAREWVESVELDARAAPAPPTREAA